MKRLICMYAFLLCLVCVLPAQEREVKLKIVQTSDVHGNYFCLLYTSPSPRDA